LRDPRLRSLRRPSSGLSLRSGLRAGTPPLVPAGCPQHAPGPPPARPVPSGRNRGPGSSSQRHPNVSAIPKDLRPCLRRL